MGYILLLLFFLVWLNVRKIRKILVYMADGYPDTLINRILNIIGDYQIERKAEKRRRKQKKPEEKKEPDPDPDSKPAADEEGL